MGARGTVAVTVTVRRIEDRAQLPEQTPDEDTLLHGTLVRVWVS